MNSIPLRVFCCPESQWLNDEIPLKGVKPHVQAKNGKCLFELSLVLDLFFLLDFFLFHQVILVIFYTSDIHYRSSCYYLSLGQALNLQNFSIKNPAWTKSYVYMFFLITNGFYHIEI